MSCLQLAIKWSSLTVIMPADCDYTMQGVIRMKDDYRFPVSFAGQQLPYFDNSSTCSSYTHMANPTDSRSLNYPSWYFDYAVSYRRFPGSNLTWSDFTTSWIGNAKIWQNTGLLSVNAYNTGSNRREFQPANFTIAKTGPSTFSLTDLDLKCDLAYRITSGSFLGLAPSIARQELIQTAQSIAQPAAPISSSSRQLLALFVHCVLQQREAVMPSLGGLGLAVAAAAAYLRRRQHQQVQQKPQLAGSYSALRHQRRQEEPQPPAAATAAAQVPVVGRSNPRLPHRSRFLAAVSWY
jgi:hypothetical protein